MILDLAIVLILVLFCVRSFRGGIQGELLGAVGWILTVLVAISFSDKLGGLITEKLPQFAVISSSVAFIFVLVCLRLIIGWSIKLFPETSTGFADVIFKIVSVAAGFFKGAFFTSVFLLLLSQSTFQSKIDSQIGQSTLYSPLSDFSKIFVRFVTEKVPNVKPLLDRSAANKNEESAESPN
jgi:uncharacterized membrane protein required for colicin V production